MADQMDVRAKEMQRLEEAAAETERPEEIQSKAERGGVGSYLDIDQTPRRPRFGARRAKLHEQFLAVDIHGRDLLEARP